VLMFQFFEEFGTHWNKALKMGARFGLTTDLSSDSYQQMQESGHTVAVTASASYDSAKASSCPGNPCDAATAKASLEGAGKAAKTKDKIIEAVSGNATTADDKKYWAELMFNDNKKPAFARQRNIRHHGLERALEVEGEAASLHATTMGALERRERRDQLEQDLLRLGAKAISREWRGTNDNFEFGPVARSQHVRTPETTEFVASADAQALNLMRDFERETGVSLEREELGGSIEASGSYSATTKAKHNFNSNSKSQSIISIGKAPSDDVMKWARETSDENMPIFGTRRPVCELVRLGLDRLYGHDAPSDKLMTYRTDPPRLPQKALADKDGEHLKHGLDVSALPPRTEAERDQVVANCLAALEENSLSYTGYCEWHKENFMPSMTCMKPLIQTVQPGEAKKKAECYTDDDCSPVSGLTTKCTNNKCKLSYNRIVDIDMDTRNSESDNQCPTGYDVVTISGRGSDQIRHHCSGNYVKICVKYATSSRLQGVCNVKLFHGSCGTGYDDVRTSGKSDGNVNQGGGFEVRLCKKMTGCEQISGTGDEKSTRPAIRALGMTTSDSSPNPPSAEHTGNQSTGVTSMVKIAKDQALDGDLNQDKWCDSVYMYQDIESDG